MLSNKNRISLRELWIQMRGVENAFRFYSDALNGIAKIDRVSYDFVMDIDSKTWESLNQAIVKDPPPCTNPPWCKTDPRGLLTDFGRIEERVASISRVMEALRAKINDDPSFGFYMSELPGTQWSGHSTPARN